MRPRYVVAWARLLQSSRPRMEVSLVAGRFAPLAGSFAFDLATGERVYLMLESLHGRLAQTVWAERCAALSGVWHPALAECLDFGGLGEEHRFVAFRVTRQPT